MGSNIKSKAFISFIFTLILIISLLVGLVVLNQETLEDKSLDDSKASGFGEEVDKFLFPSVKSSIIEQKCKGFIKFKSGDYSVSTIENKFIQSLDMLDQFSYEPVIECIYNFSSEKIKDLQINLNLIMDSSYFLGHVENNIYKPRVYHFDNYSGFGQDVFIGKTKFMKFYCTALLFHNWNLSGRIELNWISEDCEYLYKIGFISEIVRSYDDIVSSVLKSYGYSTEKDSLVLLTPSNVDNKKEIWEEYIKNLKNSLNND